MPIPQVAGRGHGLQVWRVNKNILNKHSRTANKGWSTSLVGHVLRFEEMIYVYNTFISKSQGKRPLGKPECRWEDNIKTDLNGIECGLDSCGSG
jgi:hypothetical protein